MLWFDRGGMDEAAYLDMTEKLGLKRPRVLGWAEAGKDLVVGLPDRLVLQRSGVWSQLRWVEVMSGGWDPVKSTLSWHCADHDGSIVLTMAGTMPEIFRERVQASIALAKSVELPDGGTATIYARHDPVCKRRELTWGVVPGASADTETPANKAFIQKALARFQAEYDN